MQFPQASFTGGEISPSLYGRVDLARYQSSLKTCKNYVVQPYGGVKNRAGTTYCTTTKSNYKTVLFPFQRSTETSFVLEFTPGWVRFIREGSLVTVGGNAVQVATPYQEVDLAGLKFCQSVDVVYILHHDYPPKRLERYGLGASDWRLVDADYKLGPWLPMWSVPSSLNSTPDSTIKVGASASSAVGSDITVSASKSIFTDDCAGQLLYLECQDYSQPWEVGKAVTAGDYRRSDGKYYKAATSGTTGTLRPSHEAGKWNDGGVQWEFMHYGFGVVKLKSPVTNGGQTMAATVMSNIPTEVLASGGGLESVGVGISTVELVGSDFVFVTDVPHGLGTNGSSVSANWSVRTWVYYADSDKTLIIRQSGTNIALIVDSTTLRFVDQPTMVANWENLVSGTVGDSYAFGTGGTTYWKFGAWSSSLGYPSCATFYQQRLCYASSPSQPQTIWMSRPDSYNDFGESNPLQADDAITFTIASQQLNKIEALVPMDKLLVLTTGGVWMASQGQEDVLTPNNLGVRLQGYRGSSSLAPLGIGNSTVYLQEKGQVVRDLAYEFAQDSYTSNDMTVMASHLVDGHRIVSWAYQQHPFSVIWAVRDDGVLLALTYMREQQVIGWHRHYIGGLPGIGVDLYPPEVESVCVVSEGNKDVLYLTVARYFTNPQTFLVEKRRTIERMADRNTESVYLDGSVLLTSYAAVPHLGGIVCQALQPDGKVAAVVVQADGSFTSTGLTFPLRLGAPYACDMELLEVTSQQDGSLRTKNRLITSAKLLVEEAKSVFVGSSFSRLEAVSTTSADSYDGTTLNGICEAHVQSLWERNGRLCIRHSHPSAQSILAVIPEVSIGG